MSETRGFGEEDIDITQAEGPDVETGDDLQTQLGTPGHPDDAGVGDGGGTEGLTATEAAAGPDDDTVRSN